MGRPVTRRTVLTSGGAVALGAFSGCTGETHPELFVYNRQEEPITATVEMWRVSDETTVVSETLQLATDADATWQLSLSTDPHRIAVDVSGGPSRSRTWTPWRGRLLPGSPPRTGLDRVPDPGVLIAEGRPRGRG